jgi:Integrase zinc binding domain
MYLSTLKKHDDWLEKTFKDIRHQSYEYLLKEGYLWKRPKQRDGAPLRVVDDGVSKQAILKEFHDSLWVGHRGVWATYTKIKERYWWKGLYKEVAHFVQTCTKCQLHSKDRYRDGLCPTYPPSIHFQWVIDLVAMPLGIWGMKYLVLAREELSNWVEGRALRTKSTQGVCRFVLEDIVSRYGCVGRMRADRGELDAKEAKDFFARYGIQLKLTTSWNPEANGKSERGHPPIIQALVKACRGQPKIWPRLLPFALWADRTTHSTVSGYMPTTLMLGQKPMMPAEDHLPTWLSLPWEDEISREELLELRVRQLERLPEDLQEAGNKIKQAKLKNKERFDKTHRLRPRPIKEGDWVLVYDSSLEHQHSTTRKFAKCWFGPYVVVTVHNNATYSLRELDGTPILQRFAGKRVKAFKRRDGEVFFEDPEIFTQDLQEAPLMEDSDDDSIEPRIEPLQDED